MTGTPKSGVVACSALVLGAILLLSLCGESWCYNRSAAVDYARRHAKKYNPQYPSFNADCINFVWQCLAEGGLNPKNPYYGGYVEGSSRKKSTYRKISKMKPGYLERIATVHPWDLSSIQEGDVVLWWDDARDEYYHSGIVTSVVGNTFTYCAHTTNQLDSEMAPIAPEPLTHVFFHILPMHVFWADWDQFMPGGGVGAGWHVWMPWPLEYWDGPYKDGFTWAGRCLGSSYQKRVGWLQFYVHDLPFGQPVAKVHLRLVNNNVYKGTQTAEVNINQVENTGLPSAEECLAPPYYIQDYPLARNAQETTWVDLSGTGAINDVPTPEGMFAVGLSDEDAASLHCIYGQTGWDPMRDAELKVFVNDAGGLPFGTITARPDVGWKKQASLAVQTLSVGHGVDISLDVTGSREVSLRIYDSSGRLLQTLVNNSDVLGKQKIRWNLRDQHGNPCPQGIYFVQLVTPTESITRKLVALR